VRLEDKGSSYPVLLHIYEGTLIIQPAVHQVEVKHLILSKRSLLMRALHYDKYKNRCRTGSKFAANVAHIYRDIP
jgi:hypothetical protein